MNDVVMPEIGVSMDEGTLSRWLKQPGDAVAAGEAIAEIETDKAAVELESPVDGVLGSHLVAEGATALVGQTLVRVLAAGESEDGAQAAAAPAAAAAPDPVAAPPAPAPLAAPRETASAVGDRPHRLTPRITGISTPRSVATARPMAGAGASGVATARASATSSRSVTVTGSPSRLLQAANASNSSASISRVTAKCGIVCQASVTLRAISSR